MIEIQTLAIDQMMAVCPDYQYWDLTFMSWLQSTKP